MMTSKLNTDVSAPDFALDDFRGQRIRLADFRKQRHVVLVFTRGFM